MNIPINRPLTGKKILVAVTGSIAAIKTPLLISNLIQAGAEVRCVITSSASQLISPLALSTISRSKCYQDQDQWNPEATRPLHIALAEWAEFLVVAPLTASSLSKWVHGNGEGLLASILLAFEKPVIASAAMNTAMWEHPSVKNNWRTLKGFPNVLRLSPSKGLLACDTKGIGRMASIEIIQLAIESTLMLIDKGNYLHRDWEGYRLLVTAGPTIEALDAARQLSNRSSGRMGILIAQAARFRGAEVDLIHGPIRISSDLLEGINSWEISSTKELKKKLSDLQPSADSIVMAAAVADLQKKGSLESQKKKKELLLESLKNDFEIAPDLLAEAVSKKRQDQIILGFAAVTGNDSEIKRVGAEKRLNKGCDLLMANPIDRHGQGFDHDFNGGFLLGPNKMIKQIPLTSKLNLSHELLDDLMSLQCNKIKKL